MRQVVSLIKDNQAHYALVDEDDGSIIPFADLLIPDPDRFGLHESAVLGTNLIAALGLNGHKRPKAHTPRVGEVTPSATAPVEVVEPPRELPAQKETARERRNRLAREHYHRQKTRGIAEREVSRDPSNHAERYVSMDEVMAVVNQYPEGIRLRDVADRIWRQTGGKGTDERAPHWMYTACSNRLTNARNKLKAKGIPLPFREEERPESRKDGVPGMMMGKYLLPAAPAEPIRIPFS